MLFLLTVGIVGTSIVIPNIVGRPIIPEPEPVLPDPITSRANSYLIIAGLTQDSYKGTWYNGDDWLLTVMAIWVIIGDHLNFALGFPNPGFNYPIVKMNLRMNTNAPETEIRALYTDGTQDVFVVSANNPFGGSYTFTLDIGKRVGSVQFTYIAPLKMYTGVAIDYLTINYGY